MFAISRAERWPVIESSAGASSPPVPLKEWQSEQPLLSKSCAPLFGSPIAVTARLGPPTCPEGTDVSISVAVAPLDDALAISCPTNQPIRPTPATTASATRTRIALKTAGEDSLLTRPSSGSVRATSGTKPRRWRRSPRACPPLSHPARCAECSKRGRASPAGLEFRASQRPASARRRRREPGAPEPALPKSVLSPGAAPRLHGWPRGVPRSLWKRPAPVLKGWKLNASPTIGKPPSRLSHAVVWRTRGGEVYKGRLDVNEEGLRLTGTGPKGEFGGMRIRYDDLSGIHIGRAAHERINGLRSLVVESARSSPIHVASVEGVGTIFEIGALLAELRSEKTAGTSSVAVVVPLKRGSAARARALVREGPPFDPAIRFERHHVFVSEREVVFVFEGEDVKRAVQELARTPAVWKAASAWRDCLRGPPRLAEEGYSWPRRDVDPTAFD